MGRFLYVVIMLLLARYLLRSVGAWLQASARRQVNGSEPDGASHPPARQGTMRRDPVCGRYVLESRALTETKSGQPVHFCSETCRSAYREAV